MKTITHGLCLLAFTQLASAGTMGNESTPPPVNYISIGGGYYSGNYQSDYTDYHDGVLFEKNSFNDANQSGYLQLAFGREASIGRLLFDHQVVLGKLFGNESFTTGSTKWLYTQHVDFGYDWMPKVGFFQKFTGYGILGAHYARFLYQKTPRLPIFTSFNNYADQIGFNLGCGLNYQISPQFLIGFKFQHLQYSVAQINGTNLTHDVNTIERISPAFNLGGIELRYYW